MFNNKLDCLYLPPDRPFKPSIMFVGKAGAYPSTFHVLSTLGSLLALASSIRLCWNNLPRTNTQDYYKHSKIT